MSDQYKTRTEKRNLANSKKTKQKQKKQSKSLIKRILIVLATLFIIAGISVGGVFAYWAVTAPEIDDKLLIDPISSKIYDKNGDIYTEIGSETRDYVDFKDVPKLMENAILATEDVRFYKHHGIDIIRVGGALVGNITGGFGSQGGSTITQQVVKNSFLKSEKTIKRKVQEMYLAFQLEQKYSKEQIFEMYVNKVYMSSGVHGFSTASKLYFGKELNELTLSEAATLAGMPQSPNNYNPFTHTEKAEKRRNIVLKLMEKAGFISAEERAKAEAESLEKSLVPEEQREKTTNTKYNAIIDQVIDEVEKIGDYNIYTDGLQVYTSIDPDAQELMEEILNSDKYISYPNDKFQAGTVFMDTKTGEIMAMGGGRNQEVARGFNYATDLKTRQPGSTIKPILDYGPAIEYLKWSTAQTIEDEPYKYSSGQSIGSATGTYKGNVTIREALYKSLNVPAVKTLQEVGPERAGEFAKKLGVDFGEIYEASAIGGVDKAASPLQMAGAYAAFGNEGIFNEPHVVKKVVLRDNDTVIETAPEPQVAMKDYTAFMITNILQDVVTKGTGTAANIPGLHIAAKTGTTNYSAEDRAKYNISKSSSPDAWFIGYTTNYTMSVWTGYDQQLKNPMSKQETKIAAKIFKTMMGKMSENVTTDNFKQPSSVVKVALEKGTNAKASEYTPSDQIVYEYFVKGHEPTKTSEKYSKLDAPSGLNAAFDEASNRINVSWRYDSNDAEFNVQVAVDGGAKQTLTTTKETSFSLDAPKAGSKYVFYVTAIEGSQESDTASASVSIPEAAPEEEEQPEEPAEENTEDPNQPTTPDNGNENEEEPNEGNKPEEGNNPGNENGNGNGNNPDEGTPPGEGETPEEGNNPEEGNTPGEGQPNEPEEQQDDGQEQPAARSNGASQPNETSYLIPPAIQELPRHIRKIA